MFPTDSEESNPFLHDHGGQASTSSTIISSTTGQLSSGGAGSSDQLFHRWPSQQNVSDMSSGEICRQLLEPPLGSIPRQAPAPQIGQNPGNMERVRGDHLLFQQTEAEMEMHQIKAAAAVSHGGTMLGDHRQVPELLFDPRYGELLRSRLASAGGQPFSSLLANQEAMSQLTASSSSSTASTLHGLGLMYDHHHHPHLHHHHHASLLSQFHQQQQQQQQANLTGRLLAEGHVPAQTLLQAPALSAPPLNVGAPLHVGSATRAAPRGLLLQQQQQEADQQQQHQYSASGAGGLQQQQVAGGRATTTGSAHAAAATATTYDQVDACTPRPRWCPTQEQIQILESLFNSGTTTPSRDMIVDIAAQLRKYGSIAEANVFYWFQNRKARAKRKLQPHAPQPPPPHSSSSTTTTTTSSTSISDDKLPAPPSSEIPPDMNTSGPAAAALSHPDQPTSKSRRVSLKPSSSPTLMSSSSSSSPFSHLALTHAPPLLQIPPSSLHDSATVSTPPFQLPFPHRFLQSPATSPHLSASHLLQPPQAAAAASISASTFIPTFIADLDKQRLLWSQHPHNLLSNRLIAGAAPDHRSPLDPTHGASTSMTTPSTGSPSSTTSNNPIQASNSSSPAGALLMSRTISGQQLDPRVCLSLAPPAQHQQALLNYQGTDTPTPPADEAFLQASSKGILLIDPRHSSNLGCDSAILQANPAFFSQSSRPQQLHMGSEQQPISNLNSQSSVAMPLARTDDQPQFHSGDHQASRLPVSSSPNPDQGEQQLHLWEELDTCGSLGTWGGHTDPHL